MRQDDFGSGPPVRDLGKSGGPRLVDVCASRRLTWWPELGIGYYPVAAGIAPYGQAYFDDYAAKAQTTIGRALMRARVAFVAQHYSHGRLIDVGIGSGAFIEARRCSGWAMAPPGMRATATYGWDVCPTALDWLEQRGLLADPHRIPFPAMTMWDVIEHIPDFRQIIALVQDWLFISTPVYSGPDHVLCSKHYKKDEHCWYFTIEGLVRLLEPLGWSLAAMNDMETRLGRENIHSFAFRRIGCDES